MAKKKEKTRRERLMALRNKRQQEDPEGKHSKGMLGLWAGMLKDGGLKAPQGGMDSGKGGDKDSERPLLKWLMQNPKLRQTVINLLSNITGAKAESTEGGFQALNMPHDLGLNRMGQAEDLSTSSSLEELEQYREQLENRSDWLEAALEQTLMELERINRFITNKKPRKKSALKKKPVVKKSQDKKLSSTKKVVPTKNVPAKKPSVKSAAKKIRKKPKSRD